MGKYLLVVELEDDDGTCKWCSLKEYDRMNDAWKCPFVPKRPITVNINASPRPFDCPLIPVDDLIDTMQSHMSMSPPAGYDDGIATAIWAMKMVLGLEEWHEQI